MPKPKKEKLKELGKTGAQKHEEYYKWVEACMGELPIPNVFVPVNEFAKEKVFISVAGLQLIPDCVSSTVQSLSLLEPSKVQAVG